MYSLNIKICSLKVEKKNTLLYLKKCTKLHYIHMYTSQHKYHISKTLGEIIKLHIKVLFKWVKI